MSHSNCEHKHNLQESTAQNASNNQKHDHDHLASRQQSRSKLTLVLALTASFMIVEAVVGWYTGSLALIADAGHMLGDVAALALALFAVWLSSKPAGRSRTYGFHRGEILTALANSVLLVVISIAIFCEAIRRLSQPPEIHSVPMLVVAVIGLIINLISMKLLGAHSHGSLNAKAAYLEVFADMLASCAVIAASLIIMLTGWYLADPILSGILAIFIVSRTWDLLKESVEILMESAPRDFDLDALTKAFMAVDGVVEAHDLHVWTITSGLLAMSCHLTIEPQADWQAVLNQVNLLMEKEFKISHTTIQIELADSERKCNDICAVP